MAGHSLDVQLRETALTRSPCHSAHVHVAWSLKTISVAWRRFLGGKTTECWPGWYPNTLRSVGLSQLRPESRRKYTGAQGLGQQEEMLLLGMVSCCKQENPKLAAYVHSGGNKPKGGECNSELLQEHLKTKSQSRNLSWAWVGGHLGGEWIYVFVWLIPFAVHIKLTILLIGSVCVCVLVIWLCPALCDPMDCSPPGSSVRGILQASVLEWIAIPFSMGSSWPRDWTWGSHIVGHQGSPNWLYPNTKQKIYKENLLHLGTIHQWLPSAWNCVI